MKRSPSHRLLRLSRAQLALTLAALSTSSAALAFPAPAILASSQGSPSDWAVQDDEPAPEPAPASSAEEADLDRSLRRVLVLEGGQVLRGVARLEGGTWQVRNETGWIPVDQRLVRSAELEKDLLAEMRRRERGLKQAATSAQRVEHARWLCDAGLLSESLEELDRVLSSAPHDAAARALLLERGFVQVPSLDVAPEARQAALAELITFGAKAPRAVRELAIEELRTLTAGGNEDESTLVRVALLEELRHSSLRRRSFAAHALGRLYPGDEARNLILHAVLDAATEVRREASFALGASEEPGLIVPIVKALNSPNPRVRTQAAEALGNTGFGAAVEPLVSRLALASAQGSGAGRVPHANIFVGRQKAYIQDFDVEVAQFQAVADPQVNVLIEGAVLDAGIQGLTAYGFAYETKVIRGALGQLTGESPGYSSRAWLRWWEENQERWSSARLSTAAPEDLGPETGD